MDLFLRLYELFLKHEHVVCMDFQQRDINNSFHHKFLHLCFRRCMEVSWVCNHCHSWLNGPFKSTSHYFFCMPHSYLLSDCCSDSLAVFLSCGIKPLKIILNVAQCLVFNQDDKAHVTPLASLAVPESVLSGCRNLGSLRYGTSTASCILIKDACEKKPFFS